MPLPTLSRQPAAGQNGCRRQPRHHVGKHDVAREREEQQRRERPDQQIALPNPLIGSDEPCLTDHAVRRGSAGADGCTSRRISHDRLGRSLDLLAPAPSRERQQQRPRQRVDHAKSPDGAHRKIMRIAIPVARPARRDVAVPVLAHEEIFKEAGCALLGDPVPRQRQQQCQRYAGKPRQTAPDVGPAAVVCRPAERWDAGHDQGHRPLRQQTQNNAAEEQRSGERSWSEPQSCQSSGCPALRAQAKTRPSPEWCRGSVPCLSSRRRPR